MVWMLNISNDAFYRSMLIAFSLVLADQVDGLQAAAA
jgi:hypothetical protein